MSGSAPPMPPLTTEFSTSSRGETLRALTGVLGAISIAMIGLRIGFRTAKRILGWDDLLMVITLVFLIPQMAFTFLEVPQGAGNHIAELGLLQISKQLKWIYITELFLFLLLCTTKVSICLFVLRLKNTGRLRFCLYFLMAGLVVTTIPVVIAWFAQCQPIHSFWDGNQETKCWNQNIYNDLIWVQVGFSIFGDLSCSILPIVILYRIQIQLKLKLAICGLTLVGLIATVAGIIRASLSPSDLLTDLTFDLALISIWATVEIHLGIIGANLALMRMVYLYLAGRGDTSAGSKYQKFSGAKDNTRQRALSGKTGSSQVPLEEDMYPLDSGIRKTTDYQITFENKGRADTRAASREIDSV